MKVEMRTWPFALRRLCGKWYTLALVVFAAAFAIAYSVIHDDEMLIISSTLGILVLYGGAVALASYCGTREPLDPVGRSLWEIRDGRIPVFAELQKYAGLATFALLSPLIVVAGLAVLPRLLLVLGMKDDTWAAVFTVLVPCLLILVCSYVLFRWETARNARRDSAKNTPRALYLRSFSGDASLVLSSLSRTALFDCVERALGRIFSVERLVLRALIERRFAGIAVGAPGEKLPPLGFERLYFLEEDWQQAVASLISECPVIVVNCSLTKWVGWELEEIERQGARRKLILIAHGRTADERVRKLDFALRALGLDKRLNVRDGANTISLARLDQSEPVEVQAFPDDLFAFLDAVTLGVYFSDQR
jgi:hypothetical protein